MTGSAYCWGNSRKYPFGYPFVFFMAILHKCFPQSENQYQCPMEQGLSSFSRENQQKPVFFDDFPVIFQIFRHHTWFLCRLQHLQASAAPLVPPGRAIFPELCWLLLLGGLEFGTFCAFPIFFGTRIPTDVHIFQGVETTEQYVS